MMAYASSRHFKGYDAYKPGGAWFKCDRCSQRHRRTEMYVEWDNLRVDRACLDPRPPQMSVPNIFPEGIPFTDTRAPQDRPDRLEDDTALQSVHGGFVTQDGATYPAKQIQAPGSISPKPVTGSITASPYYPEPGNTTVGTPYGVNVLADDVTFLTGPIAAPDNTNSTVPDPIPNGNL